MPGLSASFGRGAETTFQRDLANSDCVQIIGSNMPKRIRSASAGR
jgi:formate dehydrogenase major subunit